MCLFLLYAFMIETTSAVHPNLPEYPYGVYPRSELTAGGFPISTLQCPEQDLPTEVFGQGKSDPFSTYWQSPALLRLCRKSTAPSPDELAILSKVMNNLCNTLDLHKKYCILWFSILFFPVVVVRRELLILQQF